MAYYKFENLEVWQLARQFTNVIYKITTHFAKEEQFGLTFQIRRASVSIMLNIAEGNARGSNKDYVRFLKIAYASLEEVIAGCYIALDQKMMNKKNLILYMNQVTNWQKK